MRIGKLAKQSPRHIPDKFGPNGPFIFGPRVPGTHIPHAFKSSSKWANNFHVTLTETFARYILTYLGNGKLLGPKRGKELDKCTPPPPPPPPHTHTHTYEKTFNIPLNQVSWSHNRNILRKWQRNLNFDPSRPFHGPKKVRKYRP